jgi:hypothetical protein
MVLGKNGNGTAPIECRADLWVEDLFGVAPFISDLSEANTVDSDCRERGGFRIPRSSKSFLGRMFRLVGRGSTRSPLSVCVHCDSRYCSLLSSSTPSRAHGMTWVDTSAPCCHLIRVRVTQWPEVRHEGSRLDRKFPFLPDCAKAAAVPPVDTGGVRSGAPLRLDRRGYDAERPPGDGTDIESVTSTRMY